MSGETKKKAEELTDEAVEQAAGGAGDNKTYKCRKCKYVYTYTGRIIPPCPKCGYIEI